MQVKENAPVVTTDGQEVGTVDRIVIDPKTKEVTHLVVRKGLLLPEDKVVSVDQVHLTGEDVVLQRATPEWDDLPPFEERHYIPWGGGPTASYPEGQAQPYYWVPPSTTAWWGYPAYAGYFGYAPYVTPVTIERNIPEGSVALQDGARVYSVDDEHVGNVERLFVDADTDRVTHFVIQEGLFFKSKKLVPTAWITMVEEDEVHLSVEAEVLERLEEFED